MATFRNWCLGLAGLAAFIVFCILAAYFQKPTGQYYANGDPIYDTDKAAVEKAASATGDLMHGIVYLGAWVLGVACVVVIIVVVLLTITKSHQRYADLATTVITQQHDTITRQQTNNAVQFEAFAMLSAAAIDASRRGYFVAPDKDSGMLYLRDPQGYAVDHTQHGLSAKDVQQMAEM